MDLKNTGKNFKPKVITKKNAFDVSFLTYKSVKNLKQNANCCKLGRNTFKICAAEWSDGHLQSADEKEAKPANQSVKKSPQKIIKPESFNQNVSKACIDRENKDTVVILGVNNKLLKNSKETTSEIVGKNNLKPKVITKKNVFVVSSQTYKPVKNIKPNANKLGRNVFKICAAEWSDGHLQSAHEKEANPANQSIKESPQKIIKPESFNQNVSKACIDRENKKTVGILGVNNKLLKNSKETTSGRVNSPSKHSISQVKTAEKNKNKVNNCKIVNPLPEKSQDSLTKIVSKSVCQSSLQFHNENELTHGSGKVNQIKQLNIVKPVDCTKEHISFEEPYNIPGWAVNNEISDVDSGNVSSVFSLDTDENFVIKDEKQVVKTENKEHGETEEQEYNPTLTKPTDVLNSSFTIKEIVITLEEVKDYKTSPGKSITSIENFQASNNQVEVKCRSQNKNLNWTETADHKKLVGDSINNIITQSQQFKNISNSQEIGVKGRHVSELKPLSNISEAGLTNSNTNCKNDIDIFKSKKKKKYFEYKQESSGQSSVLDNTTKYEFMSEPGNQTNSQNKLTVCNNDIKSNPSEIKSDIEPLHNEENLEALQNKTQKGCLVRKEIVRNNTHLDEVNKSLSASCPLSQKVPRDDSELSKKVMKKGKQKSKRDIIKFENFLENNNMNNDLENKGKITSTIFKNSPDWNEIGTYSISDDLCLFVSTQESLGAFPNTNLGINKHNKYSTAQDCDVQNKNIRNPYKRCKNVRDIASKSDSKTPISQSDLESYKSESEGSFSSLEVIQNQKNKKKSNKISNKADFSKKSEATVKHEPSNKLDSRTSTTQSNSKSMQSDQKVNRSTLVIIHKENNKEKDIKIIDKYKFLQKSKTSAEHEPGNESDNQKYTMESDKKIIKPNHEENFSSLEIMHTQKSKGKVLSCDAQENIILNPHRLCKNVKGYASESDNKTSTSQSDSESTKSAHDKNFSCIQGQKNKGKLNEIGNEENSSHNTKTIVKHESCNGLKGSKMQSDLKSIKSDHKENFNSHQIIEKKKNKGKLNENNKGEKSSEKTNTIVELEPDKESSTSAGQSSSCINPGYSKNYSSHKMITKEKRKRKQNQINNDAKSFQKSKTTVEHEPSNELDGMTSTMQSNLKTIKSDQEENFCSFEIIQKQQNKGKVEVFDVKEKIISRPYKLSKKVKGIATKSDSETSTSLSDPESNKSDCEENFSSLEIIHKLKYKGKQNKPKNELIVDHEPENQLNSRTLTMQPDIKSVKPDYKENFSSLEIIPKQKIKGNKKCDVKEQIILSPHKLCKNVQDTASESDSKTYTSLFDPESTKSDHEESFDRLKIICKPKNKDKQNKNIDESKSSQKSEIIVEHEPEIELNSGRSAIQSDLKSVMPDHKENFSSHKIIHKQKSKGNHKACDVKEQIIPIPHKLCNNSEDISSESDGKTSALLYDPESDKYDHEENFNCHTIIYKQKNKQKLNKNSDDAKSSQKTTIVELEPDNESDSSTSASDSSSKSLRSDYGKKFSSHKIIQEQQNKIKLKKVNNEANSLQKSKTTVEHEHGNDLDGGTSTMQSSKSTKYDHGNNFSNLEIIQKQQNKIKLNKTNDEAKSLPKRKTADEHEPSNELDGRTSTMQSSKSIMSDHEDNFSSLEITHKQKSKGSNKYFDEKEKIIPSPHKLCKNVQDTASESDSKTSTSLFDPESTKSDHEESFDRLKIIHKPKNKDKQNKNIDESKSLQKSEIIVEHEPEIELNSGRSAIQSDLKSVMPDHKENFSSHEIIHKQKSKGNHKACDVKEQTIPIPHKLCKNSEDISSESDGKTSTSLYDPESDKYDHEGNFNCHTIIYKNKNKQKLNENSNYAKSSQKTTTIVELEPDNESDSSTSASESSSKSLRSDYGKKFSSHKIIQNQTNKIKLKKVNDEANVLQKSKTIVEHEHGNELNGGTSTMQSLKSTKYDHENNFSNLEIIKKKQNKIKLKKINDEAKSLPKRKTAVEHEPSNELDGRTSTMQSSKSIMSDHEDNFSSLEITHKQKGKGSKTYFDVKEKIIPRPHKLHNDVKDIASELDSKIFTSLSDPESYKSETRLSKLTDEKRIFQGMICSPKQSNEIPTAIANEILKSRVIIKEEPEFSRLNISKQSPINLIQKKKLTNLKKDISQKDISTNKVLTQTKLSDYLNKDISLSQQIPDDGSKEVNRVVKEINARNKSNNPMDEKNEDSDASQNFQSQFKIKTTPLKHKTRHSKENSSESQDSSMDPIEQTEQSESLFVSTQDISRKNYSTKSTLTSKLMNKQTKSEMEFGLKMTEMVCHMKKTAEKEYTSEINDCKEVTNSVTLQSQCRSDSTPTKHNHCKKAGSTSKRLDLEHSDSSGDSEIQPIKRSHLEGNPGKRLLNSPENMGSPKKSKTKHYSIFSETTLSMNEENSQIRNISSVTDITSSSRKGRKIQHITCVPEFEKLIPESKSLRKRRLSSSISSAKSEEHIASDIDSDATIMSQSHSGTSKSKTKPKRKMWTSTPQSGCEHLPSLQAFKSRLEQRSHSVKTNLSVVDELENQSDITSKEMLHELMEEVQTTIIASEEDLEKLSDLNINITWKLPALHREDNGSHHLRNSQILAINPHIEIDTSKFSRDEEERIKRNWHKFSKKYEFNNPSIFISSHQLYPYFRIKERLKFKQFIARKLPNRRLASVYRKFVEIFAVQTKGRWSNKEDQLLLTLYNAYNSLDESSCAVPMKTMLSKALGRTWMSIHRRLAVLLRDDSSAQLMEMQIDWKAELEGKMIHYLLRYTRSVSIEDLRYMKITCRVWSKVAAKLELPMAKIVRRWNNQLYPQLYSRQPVLRHDLYIALITWFHDHEIRSWREIDWADLSVRCGDLGYNFLYYCFMSLVNNYVPKQEVKDCRAAIDFLHRNYLPKLLKKKSPMMLKRITYDPKAQIVSEVEEEGEIPPFRIQ